MKLPDPFWAVLGLPEPFWAVLKLPEPFWAVLGLLDPPWDSRAPSKGYPGWPGPTQSVREEQARPWVQQAVTGCAAEEDHLEPAELRVRAGDELQHREPVIGHLSVIRQDRAGAACSAISIYNRADSSPRG